MIILTFYCGGGGSDGAQYLILTPFCSPLTKYMTLLILLFAKLSVVFLMLIDVFIFVVGDPLQS